MAKIAAVMCVRDESYYLPGFLEHIEGFVDSIYALDDGSVDGTKAILENHPKVETMLEHPVRADRTYDERGNREAIVRLAYDQGADWVICCDPDERFERRFLKKIRSIVESGQRAVYALHFRELWGG